ncbi:replication initiator [Streptomyces sp. 7N604]|uniref:replication initiator n=1 Tax=Streptomyces sp. 7N604 TaxID=3457415 RepID=UPI003FD04170
MQLDVRPLRAFGGSNGLAEEAVAAYVAKYVTKGAGAAGSAGGTDHRLTSAEDIDHAPVSPHVRTLMHTCWRLGGLPELEPLHLRAWAHSLGYRGHILTKSRRYSTTYAALRAERAAHERAGAVPAHGLDTVTEARWRYVGSGHTRGAALIAAGIADDLARNREIAREALGAAGDATR